jgi:hypothetical protein
VGLGPSLLSGFTAVVSRPPPVASFSLCDLRLFVIKRTYSLAWLKTDATRDLATTKSRSMAQTPEQQRGTLFARLRMELTLFSLSLFVPRALASPGSTGLRPSLPRSRQPLGRGRAVEFKPARPTRSETVSLLALQRGVSVRGEGRGVSD